MRRRDFLIGAAAPAIAAAASQKNPVQLLAVPENGIQPQIAADESGLHLVYLGGDPKHADVFYARSHDSGGSWSTPLRVNSTPGTACGLGTIRGAQLAVARGRVHVAWNGSVAQGPHLESGGFPMLYSRWSPAVDKFEPQRNLMRKTFGLDGGGSLTADRDGNVYVAWHGKAEGAAEGEAGRRVWIAKSVDQGATFAAERAATPDSIGACGCCGMRIFSDSRGALYALFRSATQNVHRDIYLLHSTDRGENFSSALLHPWNINACPMSSMSFVESRGEVIGAWETQTQIYFAPLSSGIEVAKNRIAAPPGEHPKRKYPSLAVNRRGETLVAWVEGSGWGKGGAVGWQIFDRSGRPSVAATAQKMLPAWTFPAAFALPDGRFAILV